MSSTPEIKSQVVKIVNKKANERKKKQMVVSNFEKAFSLIKNKKWKFSEVVMYNHNTKPRWECIDCDGIKICGAVERVATIITFEFWHEKIYITGNSSTDLEEILLSDEQKAYIDHWRIENEKKRKEIQEIHKNISTQSTQENKNHLCVKTHIDTISKSTKEFKCIYCGKIINSGHACSKCIELHQRKRRGVGGYPSYDPKSKGSNSLKYDR